MKFFLMSFLFIAVAVAQTISGQTTTGMPPQTVTAVLNVKKVPKVNMTLGCSAVPACSTLTGPANACIDSTGTLLLLAGATALCSYTLTNAAAGPAGVTLTNTISDPLNYTVSPATVTIPSGGTVSSVITIGATSP